VQRANALLGDCLNGTLATIDGAAHFMIATHADAVARLIAEHIDSVESGQHRHAVRNAAHLP
jgi:hypothetical protein